MNNEHESTRIALTGMLRPSPRPEEGCGRSERIERIERSRRCSASQSVSQSIRKRKNLAPPVIAFVHLCTVPSPASVETVVQFVPGRLEIYSSEYCSPVEVGVEQATWF